MEENTYQQDEPKEKPDNKAKKLKKPKLIWLIILVLVAAGAGAYWWRDNQAKQFKQDKEAEIAQLMQEKQKLEDELADEKAKKTEKKIEEAEDASTKNVDNIIASIKSGNTAALEGYMTPLVMTILAASEGLGPVTPAASVTHITNFISDATEPWDFSLSEATLAAYGAGDYATYFPAGAIVGKSANGKVISFTVNSAGKINTVFTTPDSELL